MNPIRAKLRVLGALCLSTAILVLNNGCQPFGSNANSSGNPASRESFGADSTLARDVSLQRGTLLAETFQSSSHTGSDSTASANAVAEASKSVPWPEGTSVFGRAGHFSFRCFNDAKQYSIELWSNGVLYATSPLMSAISFDSSRLCAVSFSRRKAGQPTKHPEWAYGAFPTDANLTWRARTSTGGTSSFVSFRQQHVLLETFTNGAGHFQFSDGNWTTFDGMLSYFASTLQSFALAAIPARPLPRLAREMNLQTPGLVTSFKVSTLCTQGPCEIGLIAIANQGSTTSEQPTSWYEVTVKNDQTATVTANVVDGATKKVRVRTLAKFPWEYGTTAKTVRIAHSTPSFLRVDVDGVTRACLWLSDQTLPPLFASRIGVRWSAPDDDSNVNSASVDFVHVQIYSAADWRCEASLPPLSLSQTIDLSRPGFSGDSTRSFY